MNIHQVAFRFLPDEDRLLLLINSHDKQELSFLLTRRFVKLLWPILVDALGDTPDIQRQTSSVAKQAMLDFKNEHIMSKTKQGKSFKHTKDPENQPLGPAQGCPIKIMLRGVGKSSLKDYTSCFTKQGVSDGQLKATRLSLSF